MALSKDREALLLTMSADIRTLQKSIDKMNGVSDKGFNQMEKRAFDAARAIEKSFGNVKLPKSLIKELNGFGADLGAGLSAASRTAQIALAGVSAYAIKVAADAEDINSAFTETFGSLKVQGEAAAAKIADDFKRSVVDVKSNMNTLQQVLEGLGLESEEAFRATQALAARSIDLASNKNITDARAAQAILSGLTGETEALKGLGVVITETSTKNELLRLGFKGNAEQASEAAKTTARLNLILAKTAFAQGDVARTSDGANNKLKALEAQSKDAAVALGTQLLPHFIKVTEAATDALTAFNEMPSGLQLATLAIVAFVGAAGPIASLLAGLGRVIDLARKTRLAIAGVVAANAAAAVATGGGAAGTVAGAASGAGAVALGGTAVAGATLVGGAATLGYEGMNQKRLQAVLADIRKAEDASLQAALKYLRGLPQGRVNNQFTQGRIIGEIEARAKAAADAAASKVLGASDFSLAGDQKSSGGGGKKLKATAVSGPRGRPIDPGSLLIVDEASIFDLVNSLTGAPIAASSANADGRGLSPAGDLTDFRSVSDLVDGASESLRELQDTTYDRTYYGIRYGLEAGAREGAPGIARYIGEAIRSRLLDTLADLLTNAVTKPGGGKALLAAGAGIGKLFGFASGGNPPVGQPYVVGENGPEIRVDRSPSTILPNSFLKALQGGVPARAQPVQVNQFRLDLSGAVLTQDLLDQVNTLVAQGGVRSAQVARMLARSDMVRRVNNKIP